MKSIPGQTKMRYVISVANASGTAIERAVCGCALAFHFKS